ncbi:DUF4157 domain-containing protein, partial [bacterium]|nr:DUF4157 domain-containing protein [bacterium]
MRFRNPHSNHPGRLASWAPTNVIQGVFQDGIPHTAIQMIPPQGGANTTMHAPSQPSHLAHRCVTNHSDRRTANQPTAFALPYLPPPALGQPLPAEIQAKTEDLIDADFSDVRIHIGPQATSIGALAYTQGSHIFFAPGQYNPNTPHGQKLLGHELTHVVQQRTGRVRNPSSAGVAVVQDPALEAEADRMGARVAAFPTPTRANKLTNRDTTPFATSTAAQPMFGWLGSYAGGYWGGRIGNVIDEGLDLALNYYTTSMVSNYFGSPIGEMGWFGWLSAQAGISIVRNALYFQGKRLYRAILQRIGSQSPFELGLVSWREGKFSDLVGHASVAIIRDGNVLGIFGLSPSPLPNDTSLATLARLCLPGTGQIMDDRDMLGDHSAYIELFSVNQWQWLDAQNRIRNDRNNAPTYSLIGVGGSSCASWALSVLRYAGVSGGSAMSRYVASIPREIMIS